MFFSSMGYFLDGSAESGLPGLKEGLGPNGKKKLPAIDDLSEDHIFSALGSKDNGVYVAYLDFPFVQGAQPRKVMSVRRYGKLGDFFMRGKDGKVAVSHDEYTSAVALLASHIYDVIRTAEYDQELLDAGCSKEYEPLSKEERLAIIQNKPRYSTSFFAVKRAFPFALVDIYDRHGKLPGGRFYEMMGFSEETRRLLCTIDNVFEDAEFSEKGCKDMAEKLAPYARATSYEARLAAWQRVCELALPLLRRLDPAVASHFEMQANLR